jgi:hypothetical protein
MVGSETGAVPALEDMEGGFESTYFADSNPPGVCREGDLNPRPQDYETRALPG